MLRRARRLVGNEPDARDLVQETLERALRTFHGFRPGTAVWAWLRTIMNSVWIDGWRRRQAAAKVRSLPTIDMAAPEPEPPSTWGQGHDEEILDHLSEAIARLPPIFRQVLELRLQENRSYGEIAELLGIPSRTVGTRILRARRQLREILEEWMEKSGDAREDAARASVVAGAPRKRVLALVRPTQAHAGSSLPAHSAAPASAHALAEPSIQVRAAAQ